jgi:hypothetical protein
MIVALSAAGIFLGNIADPDMLWIIILLVGLSVNFLADKS